MNDLLSAANQFLEENNFEVAASLFREYTVQYEPTVYVLANLCVAEDQTRVQFLRSLVKQYPCNIDCRLAMISDLTRLGHPTLAVLECTEAIDCFQSEKDIFLLKLSRLTAGRIGARFDFWHYDLRDLWLSQFSAAQRFHPRLLKEVGSLDSSCALTVLSGLENASWVPSQLKLLIAKQIDALTTLRDVIREAQHVSDSIPEKSHPWNE